MSIEAVSWALSVKAGSTGAKAVLIVLASHANESGQCWPRQKRIAELAEMSIDSVQRHLKEIEARGLVTRNRCDRHDGGRGSDHYCLSLPHDEAPPTASCGDPPASCGDPYRTRAVSPTAMVRSTEDESSYESSLEKDSRSVADATRPADDVFGRFWTAFPKRDGPNPKKPARAKFHILVRDGADPDAVIAGARRYAEQMRDAGKLETVYVQQAKAWLNQWSAEDDAPEPAAASTMSTKVWVKVGTDAWMAWRNYWLATRGVPPTAYDSRQPPDNLLQHGAYFDTKFPPDPEPKQQNFAKAA